MDLGGPQPSDGPSQIIGRSARLACSPCYASIIDLAIYWVCGEVVFRDEDCVSLGWCFWHRACYGCLFCGSKVLSLGVPLSELFEERRGERGHHRTKAREVEVIPVCSACSIGLEGEDVTQKSLDRVERSDGGLSRARWDMREGRVGQLRRAPASIRSVSRESFSLLRGGDGPQDGDEDRPVPLDSTIYVSMADPIGQPAFRPSPTKPIPAWMQPHRQDELSAGNSRQESRPLASIREAQAPTSTSESSTERTARSVTPVFHPKRRSQSPSLSRPAFNNGPLWDASQQRRNQSMSWVSNEPLKRPSSRLAARIEKSDATTSSGYVTPPETPVELVSRYKTPPPQLRRVQPMSPLAPVRAQRRPAVRRTPPPQSSEYLERYNPIRSPSPRPWARGPAVVALRRASRGGAGTMVSEETAGGTVATSINRRSFTADGADWSGEGGFKMKNPKAWKKLFGK
ncbi:mediator of rna polymerase ii transcription [Colletotrichum plurivorum]|uniref:Mediator of rna polymerase ii transcription n=1 Tax=Colletotrichum plurivorum TaxID=2175906 RepID=A0A8H6NMC0_9PEZI|nr:mediator of rna polymerase ii transcription [Colletotrichum plurivorum]